MSGVGVFQVISYLVAEFLPLDGQAHLRLISYYFSYKLPGDDIYILIYFSSILGILSYYSKDIGRIILDTLKGSASVISGRKSVKLACVDYHMFNFTIVFVVISALAYPVVYYYKMSSSDFMIGVLFVISALIMRFVKSFAIVKVNGYLIGINEILVLSVVQILCMIPGLPRTALFIGVGHFLGIERKYVAKLSYLTFIPLLVYHLYFMQKDVLYIANVLMSNWLLLVAMVILVHLLISLVIRVIHHQYLYKFYVYLAGVGIWTMLDMYFKKRGL